MKNEESQIAEVLDFSKHKIEQMILAAKRNPKITQNNICTLEAVLDLYLEGSINISWVKGEPYMSLSPDVDFDEEALKEKFSQIIAEQ